jgi:cytochrome c553
VGDIDNAVASALARFYARQPPPRGAPGDPRRIEKGRALFEKGSQEQVACAVCHGLHAEGAGIFPRLAGQHPAYLQHQLQEKQRDARRTSIMHGMIDSLSVDDMRNLAAYLASIP